MFGGSVSPLISTVSKITQKTPSLGEKDLDETNNVHVCARHVKMIFLFVQETVSNENLNIMQGEEEKTKDKDDDYFVDKGVDLVEDLSDFSEISDSEDNSTKKVMNWHQLYNLWRSKKEISKSPLTSKIEFLNDFKVTQANCCDSGDADIISLPKVIISLPIQKIDELTAKAWKKCTQKVFTFL